MIQRYEFALKSFREGNKHVYDNEKNAFMALKCNEGMVKYLGDYGHPEAQPGNTNTNSSQDENDKAWISTHNILLQYGEYDLDEYFSQRWPPVFPTEIETFWKSLFEVADAVNGIHNLHNKDGVIKEFHG